LLIEPRRRRSPVDDSRGVSPTKLARWRPEGKRDASPTTATSAVAVNSPMPGTERSIDTTGVSRATASIWRSTAAMRASRSWISSQAMSSVERIASGRPESASPSATLTAGTTLP